MVRFPEILMNAKNTRNAEAEHTPTRTSDHQSLKKRSDIFSVLINDFEPVDPKRFLQLARGRIEFGRAVDLRGGDVEPLIRSSHHGIGTLEPFIFE
jgi:hypothetical protein